MKNIDNEEAYELGEQAYLVYRKMLLGSRFWAEIDASERIAWIRVGAEMVQLGRKLADAQEAAKATACAGCGGHGYSAIRNGCDDIECTACGGTGNAPTGGKQFAQVDQSLTDMHIADMKLVTALQVANERLHQRLTLADGMISNMLFNLKQQKGMEMVIRALEGIKEVTK